jgi:predicted PurR-regulated permease PerM
MASEPERPRLGPRLFAPSRLNLKTVLTVCSGVTLFAATLYALWHTRVALLLTALGLLVAVPLDHTVRRLQQHGVRRRYAVIAVIVALIAILAAVIWIIVPVAIAQLGALTDAGPKLLDEIRHSDIYRVLSRHVDLDRVVESGKQDIREHPEELAATAFNAMRVLGAAAGGLIAVLVIASFMLVYGSSLVRWTLEMTLPEHRPRYRRAIEHIYDALGGYIAGAFALVCVNTLATTLFLMLLGVPYFLPLGLLSGLGSLVPILGVTISGLAIALVAAVSAGPWVGLAAVAYIAVYQQVENHLLEPLVFWRTVRLNPLLTVLAVLFLGELGGLAGAVLAVPALAVMKIVTGELLAIRAEQLDLPPTPPPA